MHQPHPPVPPRRMARVAAALCVIAAVLAAHALCGVSAVRALQSDMRAVRLRYPDIVGSPLNNCRLCHVTDTDFRLNPYGRDLERNDRDYAAIEPLDSDGDGFSNLVEIAALTFPGNPASLPTATLTATVTATPTLDLTPTLPATGTHTPIPTDAPTGAPTHATPASTEAPVDAAHVLHLPFAQG